MLRSRKTKILLGLIFVLSIGLRLALVAFNREANDAHETVANLIIQSGELPQKDACWECFQPKLFHYVFARVLMIAGLEENPGYQQNIIGQLINFFASIAFLIVTWLFIDEIPLMDEKIKLLTFALVGLNPNLLGINSQATNDTFAILFSSVSLFFAYEYFLQPKTRFIVLSLLFATSGIASKTNAWVTAIAIFIALLIRTWVSNERKQKFSIIAIGFLLATITLSLLNPLDQYIDNFQDYNSFVLMNINRDPFPHFTGELSSGASGIWYIQDGFLTFKFLDLLKHPRLDPNTQELLPHQTSFWTVLYGRSQSIHFDNAPPAWSTTGETLFNLTRGVFLLGLIPTAMIIFGFFREAIFVGKSLIRKDVLLARATSYGLFAATAAGYIMFQMLYSFQYRSVTVIKAIFIFPAILAFAYLFLNAANSLYGFSSASGKRWLSLMFEIVIVVLLMLYVVDISTLIIDLAQVYINKHF